MIGTVSVRSSVVPRSRGSRNDQSRSIDASVGSIQSSSRAQVSDLVKVSEGLGIRPSKGGVEGIRSIGVDGARRAAGSDNGLVVQRSSKAAASVAQRVDGALSSWGEGRGKDVQQLSLNVERLRGVTETNYLEAGIDVVGQVDALRTSSARSRLEALLQIGVVPSSTLVRRNVPNLGNGSAIDVFDAAVVARSGPAQGGTFS